MDIHGNCDLKFEFRGLVEQTTVLIAQFSLELWPIKNRLLI